MNKEIPVLSGTVIDKYHNPPYFNKISGINDMIALCIILFIWYLIQKIRQ